MTLVPTSTSIQRSATLRAHADLARSIVRARTSRAVRAQNLRRDAFYRDVWLAAAAELGMPARWSSGSTVEIDVGAHMFCTSRSACSLETPEALAGAGDKILVHQLLRERGIPTPRYEIVTLDSLDGARPFVDAMSGCVVKPARDCSGGRGVTTQVHDIATLALAAAAAAAAAARASRDTRAGSRGPLARVAAKSRELRHVPILVEEFVRGDNYRLLYLDGSLVDAVRRANPTVVGDGHSTVRKLILQANTVRQTSPVEGGASMITDDRDLSATLAAQGFDRSSVPADGHRVVLKTSINEGAIADHVSATARLCPSIIEQGAEAATVAGTRLVGVDVITSDPSVPLTTSHGCILEINTTPGLVYHYHHQSGQVDVCREVLNRLRSEQS